jgi:MOSC domain-containing protein YiiM
VGAGDAIELVSRDPHGLTIADVHALYAGGRGDRDGLVRAAAVPALPQDWRAWCERRLAELDAVTG